MVLDKASRPLPISVRLSVKTREKLGDVVCSSRSQSEVLRAAVEAYVRPLVAVLDGEMPSDWPMLDHEVGGHQVVQPLAEAIRFFCRRDVVTGLNRLEAYARRLGHLRVDRSVLVRRAVDVYLANLVVTP